QARGFARRRLARHPVLHLASHHADLGKAVGATRAGQTVEPGLERGRRLRAEGAERRDVGSKLVDALGKFREILALQLQHSAVEGPVGHGPRRKCSSARRAPATNAGAVLQWPRTSPPWRAASKALRPSTTLMIGIPGH